MEDALDDRHPEDSVFEILGARVHVRFNLELHVVEVSTRTAAAARERVDALDERERRRRVRRFILERRLFGGLSVIGERDVDRRRAKQRLVRNETKIVAREL